MSTPTTGDKPVDPIKDATITALRKLLDPLLQLMFMGGVTVQELNNLTRDGAVTVASRRLSKVSGRTSKSRLALITGLPRAEITRITNRQNRTDQVKPKLHPARRLLEAWHSDARYLEPSGVPAVLPIFGKRRSFERLVSTHGGGIPVRAMLDELIQLNVVTELDGQKISPKSRVPIMQGLNTRSIEAIGDRGRDLLNTLTHNVRHTTLPRFEATAVLDDADVESVSLLRREITEQGKNLITSASSILTRGGVKRKKRMDYKPTCRLGVTVYYFQDDSESDRASSTTVNPRKNLRRRRQT